MNSCHVCASIPKKNQIIACDDCDNEYCLKCINVHLTEPSLQKYFLYQNQNPSISQPLSDQAKETKQELVVFLLYEKLPLPNVQGSWAFEHIETTLGE